jgi:hypothetical protein
MLLHAERRGLRVCLYVYWPMIRASECHILDGIRLSKPWNWLWLPVFRTKHTGSE